MAFYFILKQKDFFTYILYGRPVALVPQNICAYNFSQLSKKCDSFTGCSKYIVLITCYRLRFKYHQERELLSGGGAIRGIGGYPPPAFGNSTTTFSVFEENFGGAVSHFGEDA
jgi:hypothetical protein